MNDSEVNVADNMVNLFMKRLQEFSLDSIKSDALKELNAWRDDCTNTINEIYQRKLDELNAYVDKLKVDCGSITEDTRASLEKLEDQHKKVEEDKTLTSDLQNTIERNLKRLEDISIKYNIRPLNIDDSYVYMVNKFNLGQLSSAYVQINYPHLSSSALASNGEFLLIHQHPYLCLIDRDCRIVRQKPWELDWIRDMCWSATLKRFLVITTNHIYSVNDMLEEYITVCNDYVDQNWFSCTCSDDRLYISTFEWGSSVVEFDLNSNFAFTKHWQTPDTCESDDGINDIKYQNETFALMINNSKRLEKRMELKSIKDFGTIWCLNLSAGANIRLFTCCPINCHEWLVVDGTNSNVYHVSHDGKFQQNIRQNAIVYRATQLSANLFAIVTENHLDLYRLSQ